MSLQDKNLPKRLERLLATNRPPRTARNRFASELGYGRANGPTPCDARPAAVVALLYPDGAGWSIPLTLRPIDLPSHGGQISLPGGMVEPGETNRDAALRELEEELGVPHDEVRILGMLSELYVFSSHCRVVSWVGIIDREPEWIPEAKEVAEVVPMRLSQLMDPSRRATTLRQVQGVSFRSPHIAIDRHKVWGATCLILGDFIDALEEVCNA